MSYVLSENTSYTLAHRVCPFFPTSSKDQSLPLSQLSVQKKFAKHLLKTRRQTTVECNVANPFLLNVSGYSSQENSLCLAYNKVITSCITLPKGFYSWFFRVDKRALYSVLVLNKFGILTGISNILSDKNFIFNASLFTSQTLKITFDSRNTENSAFFVVRILNKQFGSSWGYSFQFKSHEKSSANKSIPFDCNSQQDFKEEFEVVAEKKIDVGVKSFVLVFNKKLETGYYEIRWHCPKQVSQPKINSSVKKQKTKEIISADSPYVYKIDFVINDTVNVPTFL
ncbi:hypothetical protein EIN_419680 [Entamoeba invadens IP1]|uniref:Uncharacterized protein n=1 Tax=Entamoeba invadens IP1 TaxID=370355 RepID=A0A0A1U1X9_ENTIV|nr:hypothetical protein EIN_419680 [Entamoeba invadens IP1]ELP88019.1 hypothetical protein EIN_419680 [Entamoeba invadens IP1]|eukprot:XP_004254790.1 hypothetical protein EIN_419680 [Entamoeba invadens IP1]